MEQPGYMYNKNDEVFCQCTELEFDFNTAIVFEERWMFCEIFLLGNLLFGSVL